MRSIGLFLFVSLFGFITHINAQNGSAGQPFTSLGQAQNVVSDGVYYFSLSGTTFSTYVRVGGWVQVAIDFDSGVGNLPQSNALNNTVRGILTPTALSKLGSATVTRLLTSNGQLDVQNSMPGIVTRIVNNQTLLAVPADNTDNGGNWTGTNTLATQFTNYGNTTAYGLHSNFFHAGNNGDGIHWIPFFNMQQIKNSAGEIPNGAYFQLLVRAPMVAVVMGPTINTQPSSTAQNLCINSAANALSVSASSPNGSAITYQWYSNASASTAGGTAIGGATSSSYTPPSNVVGTLYYYVICTNNQGLTTSNVSGGITIQGTSVGGTASSNQTVCGGSSPTNLTLTSNTGTIQWQSSTDNINFNNIVGATSATLTSGQMGAINTTTYYRAIVTNGSCTAAISNTITINISTSPTFSSTTGASRCGTGTVTLQATTAAGTINWYAASTGGASLGSGTSFTTPSINTTTTYYADVTNNGCTSTPRTAVVATVNAAPPTPTITQSGCGVLTLGNNSGGNALDFGSFNSSSYITIPASLNTVFNTNNVTLEGWFKFDANNVGFPMLIGEAYIGDLKITFCMHKQGNNINAGFYNNGWTVATSATTIQYNTWMHIAATYDQTSIKIYINGNLDATLNANAVLPTGSESWYIGKRWDSNDFYRGVMDEIRIWNVARTQAQIQASMNTTIPTNSTGLRAYYKLDESAGTSPADATGNGYNGTLTSGSTWQVPSTSVLAGPATTILWSPTNQTTSVITAANSGTYSAVVTTTAGCQSAPVSAIVSIGVSASSNQTICSGTSPANLSLTGTTATIQWQSSTDNVNFTNIAGATSSTLSSAQMGNLNATTYYRAYATSAVCPASYSNTVTITVNTTPTLTSTTGASICGTGTLTLQATTASGIINWYAASTGGASLGTGTSYTTPSLSTTTTYYVSVTNNGCSSNPRTAVVATVSAAPPTPTITQSNCGLLTLGNYGSGNALNLGVSNTSKYVSIPSSINTSFNTNNITVEGWFNLSAADPSLPEPMLIGEAYISDNKVTFMLSRYSNQIRAGFFSTTWSLATSASNIPANTWTHIAATYDQTSIKIYINGVLDGTLNATAPIPTGNEVWYLGKRFGGADMISGIMDEVRIWNVARTQAQIQTSMNTNIPVNSTGLRAYYKLDESTGTIAADATGNGYDGTLMNGPTWQVPSTSILGGPPVSFLWSPTGQTTNSITAATSGTYSAFVTNSAGCQSPSVSSSIVVGVTASSNQTICSGTSPANLTLTGTNTTIQWQSSTDNINFTNIAGATSATLTAGQMGTLNTTTYYRAIVTNTGCAASTSNTITVTVNPTPSFTNTTGASICGGPSVSTLQASAAVGTINWYAASTGGASLGTGTSYTTPSIAATTTYYVDVTNNGCTSTPRTAVVATVNSTPTITSSTGATICVSGTGTLQAAAATGTINWYAALTGGSSLGTGTSYVTPNIATTTTYYADVTNNGCTSSPRTSIVATVIPSSTASSNQTVCPGLLPSAITLTSYSGTIQWQTSSNNSTFTNIAGQTSATLPANAIGIMAGTKYIRAMVTNGACVTPSNVVTLSPANVNVLTPLTASSYVWNGQSSSDWGTLSNWYSYNGTSLVPAATLPGSTANTIIPANTGCILTQPTLSSGAIIINSLVLETGSQLTQSGGSLLLYTNLVKNGNIVSTGGLINFYGPTSATISGSGAVQFAKMRVNKLTGATLTLQIPVTVSDSLTMIAGNIYTTTNNLLTLGLNSATAGKLAYTNGTIVGPFKRFFANAAISGVAGRFPVGTATYNRYAQFSFASSPGVDQSLTVNYASGAPLSGGNILYNGLPHWASGSLMQNYSADGYWNVIPTNNDYTSTINTSPYDVTLFANNLTGMQTPQVCRIIKSAGSNTAAQHHVAWSACGTHTAIAGGANPLAFLISSTAAQGFSWFNIGTPNSQALPVEFAGMTTTCDEEAISIRWSTESEHNNDYFRIEKSTDGNEWDILGYVDAVGNSSLLNGYEYMDVDYRSNSYYRLYQVDQDGSEKLLSTLYTDCDVATDEISSFPNPSHESFSIFWKQFNTSGDGTITIRDINGKTMHHENVALSLGANLFIIKEHLAPGVYVIELIDDNYERRLIKHIVK